MQQNENTQGPVKQKKITTLWSNSKKRQKRKVDVTLETSNLQLLEIGNLFLLLASNK